MCNKYVLTSLFGTSPFTRPTYNASQYHKLPVIVGKSEVQLKSWGFLPAIRPQEMIDSGLKAKPMTKARSETIFERKLFKNAILHRRCLVPMNGFYIWMKLGGEKIPHYVYQDNQELLYAAGIWENGIHPKSKTQISTFAVITKKSEPQLKILNPRMPVLLNKENQWRYLRKDLDSEQIEDFFEVEFNQKLSFHSVSKKINLRKINNQALICPSSILK